MTDLTRERIEEIKKWKSLFDRGEVVNFLSVGETHDLARQLLATMTERDEAQAAQAGVCETMAARCDEHARHEVGREAEMLKAHAAYFRSLADPTGVKLLAELRARAEKGAEVNVKTLSWTEGKFCGQDMFFADTPFGAWMVVRYSGRDFRWAICDPLGNDSDEDWSTPELAMAAAQGDHIARVRAALSAAPTGEESRG